jgi:hypothetical protein
MHLLAAAASQSPYQIRLSALVVTIVIGTFLPLVVGLVTKLRASSALKGSLLLILDGVNALIVHSTMDDGVAVFSKQTLILWFASIVQSQAMFHKIWKPLGAPEALAPQAGIGGGPGAARRAA